MMLIETCVRPSSIHGLGLFALQFVPRGTPVWRFAQGFDHDFSPAQFAALPPLAQTHTRWFCFVSRLDGHVILSGDHACFINHSPDPNTGALPEGEDKLKLELQLSPSPNPGGLPDTKPPVVTVALRDIAAGEELTCNYHDYDADTPWKLGLVPPEAPLGTAAA